ncbi:MAG: ATP-binding protein [Deltaproteobacteria bacterium]|nr:ATP-binding protein [Deltaproteobacteria bacterium]
MSDSHPQAMPKEICCRNWVHLLDYIENTPNLQGGFSGRAAVDKVLERLVDNPEYLIEDPDNPGKAYPVKEAHLRDGSYWHSHAFSLKLFENAARIIGGYRPLFQAGITAGYRMFESAQPKHFQLLRLLSPKTTLRLVGFINRKFNKTKDPKGIEWRKDFTKIGLNYRPEFKGRVSSEICDWNAGIYMGIGRYTGCHNVRVTETECLTRGGEDCVFEIHWSYFNAFRRFLVFCHSIVDPEYIRGRDLDNLALNDLVIRQEGIIDQRTRELKKTQAQLIESEKRALEHRITGGFAHEMRNALAGAQLEFKTTLNYKNQGKPSAEVLKDAATNILKNISLIHDKYKIPREKVATLLLPELKTIAEIADHLKEIHTGVFSDLNRGLSITTQIRDYARMSEFKPGSETVDLLPLLKEYGDRYQQDFERIGITYSVEGPDAAVVKADETHLNSIFSNLVLNAKDALEEVDSDQPKAITVTVDTKEDETDRFFVITVADNGPGIPEKNLNEIFEPFYSTKPTTGTGLGLGVVKRLVQLYHGTIEVTSETGKGATFTIMLKENRNG